MMACCRCLEGGNHMTRCISGGKPSPGVVEFGNTNLCCSVGLYGGAHLCVVREQG